MISLLAFTLFSPIFTQDIAEHNGYRQCSFTVIRTLEDICGRIENPRRLQEMLGWLLELFVQRSVEVQKICERENTPLKDKAANIGNFPLDYRSHPHEEPSILHQ